LANFEPSVSTNGSVSPVLGDQAMSDLDRWLREGHFTPAAATRRLIVEVQHENLHEASSVRSCWMVETPATLPWKAR
jgi:hypothetical protein